MFERISPEAAGISSRAILGFIKILEKYNLNTHSLILARGNNIISETYYAPFHKDFKHRMYSVSKSFVSVAIGLLEEEGFISLDDRFVNYFPEYVDPENCDENLREMTLREMLTMETCHARHINWFALNTDDRSKVYFQNEPDYMAGGFFNYDSPGSYMLDVIVEKVTGIPFLEYMQRKFLNDIGFSKDSYCLKCPGGHSFGDSGVMCSARDLLTFARFVMNGGTWEGKRYMNEEYLRKACSKIVANNIYGAYSHSAYGYGYQIWQAPNGGFAFLGMGDQLAICDVEHDFILIINSDNQGSPNSKFILYHALYDDIIEKLSDTPLPEDEEAYRELMEYENSRILNFARGNKNSPFENEYSGRTYILKENPMGITKFRIDLSGDTGTLYYTNAQGDKELKFGFGHNEFQKFPQEGYSDIVGGNDCPGNLYDCAVSADWLEDRKLHLKVQVIDKYFGILDMAFSFKDSRVTVLMEKTAENFFLEYCGYASGRAE